MHLFIKLFSCAHAAEDHDRFLSSSSEFHIRPTFNITASILIKFNLGDFIQ